MQSDSEDDSDYVPPNDPGSEAEEGPMSPARKRARVDVPREPTTASSQDAADSSKQSGADAYAAFKASLNAPSPQSAVESASPAPQTVKIVRRYRFAGEEITEVKEVPADSPEAKTWPLWKPVDDISSSSSPGGPSTSHRQGAVPSSAPTPSAPAASSSSTATKSTPAKPPGKRPGPRKPKTTLAPIPKKEAAKKLTTLDKSAMDWRAHVEGAAPAEIKDELEAHRRGGGYLEKVEFLQRVEARKEEVLDASKGKRRR